MDSRYNPAELENKWYQYWEEGGYFKPQHPDAKPFTIILPPPNANASLHVGHAMYIVEDILVRFHRMLGDNTLWLPGADHAGFETQVVYEKNISKEGKSRFDFDRQTLYQNIYEFVLQNRDLMEDQCRRLGFSLDWSRRKFTLDPDIIKTVYDTFFSMHEDELIYRGFRMVNYCTKDGTAFSDLEVDHEERVDPLYFLKYKNSNLELIVATVRPETIFGDVAIAVHPDDTRYAHLVDQEQTFDGLLGPQTLKIIADEAIDPTFGTGAVKVTPSHSQDDFEIAQRHNLPLLPTINLNGRLNEVAGKYNGLKILPAREQISQDLIGAGLMDHIDTTYSHNVNICYKCKTLIEPMVMPNWFIKTKDLAAKAHEAITDGRVAIIPEKPYAKVATDWLEHIIDWNISRQIVFGIRIPAWYNLKETDVNLTFLSTSAQKPVTGQSNDLLQSYTFTEIETGLQSLRAPQDASYIISESKPNSLGLWLQETDVFDTWFSSAQWPFATLGYPHHDDFKTFYPTSVIETGADILRFWVCRMIMMGLYRTGDIPFQTVYLHGLVVDKQGAKMSKSKGNVVNPLAEVEKYGADALRFSLMFNTAPGSNQPYLEDKTKGMRNFATKIWNISRFILLHLEKIDQDLVSIVDLNLDPDSSNGTVFSTLTDADHQILGLHAEVKYTVTKQLTNYRFSDAAQQIYEFVWHQFADQYIEQTKERLNGDDPSAKAIVLSILVGILQDQLKLLHPFMPYVTEEINFQVYIQTGGTIETYLPLIISPWPTSTPPSNERSV